MSVQVNINFTKIGGWMLGIMVGTIVWIPAYGYSFVADWKGHWIVGAVFFFVAIAFDLLLIGGARGDDL